jgi:hypothetical protein
VTLVNNSSSGTEPSCDRILFMFDDFHLLPASPQLTAQRFKRLFDFNEEAKFQYHRTDSQLN